MEWIDQNQGCLKKLNQDDWRRNKGLIDEGSEERWSQIVAQAEVNLCKAGLWGRVAMIMKAQNPFRNRAQVIEVGKQRLSG